MESNLASEHLAAAEPGLTHAVWRGRWRGVLGRFRAGVPQHQIDRTRQLGLHTGRICGMGISLGLLAAALSVADVWQTHRIAAQEAAALAIGFVDARLDDIDFELAALKRDLELVPDAQQCTAAATAALVRASLSSTHVKRFMLGFEGVDHACHPEGRAPAFTAPQRPGRRLALYSTGEIATQLMVIRAGDGGSLLAAVLDSRVFDAQAGSARSWTEPRAIRVTLSSADARPLARLGHAAPTLKTVPALQARQGSQRHAVIVEAHVERAGLWAALWTRALAVLMATGLALLAGVSWVWSRAVLRSRLAHRIEQGLKKRQFEPEVQPIVDLATGRCAGAEVLMRWAHPQRGMLAPGEFIEEAERTGLIVPMSDLVMARAAHRLAPLAAAHPELYFSFNVTPAQLRQPPFALQLAALFHADTLPREQVLLELTEREAVDPNVARALAVLHAQGWRVAIDDFGTGHSSLASLEQLPIDRIKIDRAFVSTIGKHTVKRPVLDAIIAMADQLKVRLIAEGVETQAQWDYLAARGVQYAQGYLIARPMPIEAFAQWLAAQQPARAAGATTQARAQPEPQPAVDALALQLWQHMRTSGGLDSRDRIYRLNSYPQCFVGREAVDWLVRHQRVGRGEAVRLGKRLAALGLIRHVLDEHDFQDAELFYRLSSPVAQDNSVPPQAEQLQVAIRGAQGVAQRDHARGLMRYRQCTPGREIVDWVVRSYAVPRVTAVQWAAQLMRKGSLRHVFDDEPFRDDRTLYRLA